MNPSSPILSAKTIRQLLLPLGLCICLCLSTANAQEKVESEQISKIAQKLLDLSADSLKDAALKVDADPEKGDALKYGDYGFLVLPDKKFSAATLDNAGADIMPIGQLYLKGLAPATDGKVVSNDQLRIISVTDKETEYKIPLCLLGLRKQDGKLEMVLFGKDKTPLLHSALDKSDSSQSLPIVVSGEKVDDNVGRIILDFGKYKASFLVMLQES